MLTLQSAFGTFFILAIAWGCGENRRHADLRAALGGLAITFAFAALLIKLPWLSQTIALINSGVESVAQATRAGTAFAFGFLGGGPVPYEITNPAAQFIFVFQALPVVLVISALTSLLFHWKILQPVIHALSAVLRRSLGVSGAVGLSTAANVFLGMVEAPLFIRPYLARLTRCELFMVMTGGMAGIAGTVFVLYAILLRPVMPDASGHLMIASLVSAPAALVIARLMVPELQADARKQELQEPEPVASSMMDAIVRGTQAGLELFLSITAMLIVLVALVALCNSLLGLSPMIGDAPLSLERILGWIMAPICWLMGIPWNEAVTAGKLMGIKTVLNELLAYVELSKLDAQSLSERSRLIMIYALCGFANFGSLGIMIAGLSSMAPERRDEILQLGPKSILSGTLSTCLMGALVGVLM